MALLTDDKIDRTQGMILSEILLAGAIISLALASAVIIVGSLQSMVIDMQNAFEAQLKARQEISMAHMIGFNDLANFTKNDGIFTTVFSAIFRNDFTANISADVSWYEGSFQKHRVMTDQIVDWQRASGAPDCDWLDNAKGNLTAVNFGTLNADDLNPITDVATLGGFVYVSADSASSSLPDIYVVDVSDIQNPKIVSHLNTGPGIASIAAAGHYIFAANAGSYQMQIIDVADPVHPSLVSQAKLPGVVVSGSSGFGQSVHFYDNKMYIGLTKNNGSEFHVVDVANPQAPIAIGSYEIGSTVNDIDVQGDRAAVVTPGQNSIFLLNISNPQAISEITRASFSGWQTQGAQSVEMLGQQISVGRTLGGFYSPYPELMLLNRDNPSSASTTLKIGATVENIFGFNNYLYLTTSDPSFAFQVLRNDTANNASSTPTVEMSATLSSRGVALACNRKAMYVVTQDDRDFFHIFSSP